MTVVTGAGGVATCAGAGAGTYTILGSGGYAMRIPTYINT